VQLVMATADTATGASERASFTAFNTLLTEWTGRLRRWRCGLSAVQRQRLGAPAGWKCNDLRVYIDRLGFDQFGTERAAALNAIPTRFNLPQDSVDLLISAGAEALRGSGKFQEFRRGL
jgi:NTE family protein